MEVLSPHHRYGFHTLKLPSLFRTVERVWRCFPYNTMQIYIASGRSYTPPKCDFDDVVRARQFLVDHDMWLCIHGCLLYNLCGSVNHSKDDHFSRNLTNTINNFSLELDIGAGLGCGGVVIHPNSCKDKSRGLKQISETIETVLTRDTPITRGLAKKLGISKDDLKKQRLILLENCAGEGTKRGQDFEELKSMIVQVPEHLQPQIKICIDTAHAFGSGMVDFGVKENTIQFYKDFDECIGLEHLGCFHLNDSRRSESKKKNAFFGSKKDVHENLGLGYIFGTPERLSSLETFFDMARKHNIPIIGEPPAKNEDGSPGLRGKLDWVVVRHVLEDTKYPLMDKIK